MMSGKTSILHEYGALGWYVGARCKPKLSTLGNCCWKTLFARGRRPSPCPASAHTQSGISRFSVYSLKKNFVHFIMAEQRIQQECNSRTSRQRLGAQSSQGRCRPRFSERKVGAFHFFYFFFARVCARLQVDIWDVLHEASQGERHLQN